MAGSARATAFVTGSDGLLGTELRAMARTRRVSLDANLLDAVSAGATRRTVPGCIYGNGARSGAGHRAMNSPSETARIADTFESVVLPHLDAARRLARWLVANEHDAEDVVQEACVRALRYFRTFSGGNSRAWFLRIVRNTCYGSLSGRQRVTDVFDEEQHSGIAAPIDPETLALRAATADLIEHTMSALPARSRELLVLRELEGLSYQELADVLGMPIGSVMSGLSRARHALRSALEVRLRRPDRAPDEACV